VSQRFCGERSKQAKLQLIFVFAILGKGKVIPLQAWCGLEGG